MSLVGQFYFESLRSTGSPSDDPRGLNTEVSPSQIYKGLNLKTTALSTELSQHCINVFSSLCMCRIEIPLGEEAYSK